MMLVGSLISTLALWFGARRLAFGILVVAGLHCLVHAQQQLVRLSALNVQCGDTSMTVNLQFDKPFQGIIFSKGYYSQHQCVYVQPGQSSTQYQFVIPYDGCGSTAGGAALSSDGRPAQFLRSLDGDAAELTDSASSVTGTQTEIIVNSNRTRRGAADDSVSNNTSSSDILKPLGRSFEDFGGGDPNAREFLTAHNMFNNDEQMMSNFVDPREQLQAPRNNLYSRQGADFSSRYPAQSPNNVANRVVSSKPALTASYSTGNIPLPQQSLPPSTSQTFVPSFQQPQQQVPVLQESVPDERQQQLFYPQQQQQPAITSAIPAVIVPADNVLPKGTKFMENVLIIQFDANIQEVWDVAKALRCEWHDSYHKRVTYKPMNVGALDIVEAAFAGDNIGVWMTVQQGQGPFAPEVNGIVRIGQKLTLTIGIQDPSQQFDMRVLNCIASDGTRPTIQLVDEYGCVVRPKIMAPFQKTRNVGPQAQVVSYATFQAFKFPDSVDVNIECSVEVCKHGCPKQCFASDDQQSNTVGDLGARRTARNDDNVPGELSPSESRSLNVTITQASNASDGTNTTIISTRKRRQAQDNNVGVARRIKVVSMNDMLPFFEALRAVNDSSGFGGRGQTAVTAIDGVDVSPKNKNDFCIAPSVFIASTILLFGALIVTVLVLVFLCMKIRITQSEKDRSIS